MKKIIGSKDTYAMASSLGGIVTEFVWKGSPIIYPERTIGEKSRGGIPICFPFFGKPTEGLASIPRHGWLRKQELALIEESENHVVFQGRNKPTKVYPWLLEYEVRVSIDSEKGLDLKFGVTRFPDGQYYFAPINPGFHPYFSNLGDHIAVVGANKITEFHKDSAKIGLNESIFIDTGKWLMKMELGGDFSVANSCLTLWSDDADKYFCVEPVSTWPNCFANPEGGKFLRVGERSEITCAMKPIAQSM